MLTAIIPITIPFITNKKNKWGPLIALKRKMDAALDTVQAIAESVEDVAERVDQMADEVKENLPEGSQLRNIIERIDDIAEETIKQADCAEELLQKVEDVGDKIETMIMQTSDMDRDAVAATNFQRELIQVEGQQCNPSEQRHPQA